MICLQFRRWCLDLLELSLRHDIFLGLVASCGCCDVKLDEKVVQPDYCQKLPRKVHAIKFARLQGQSRVRLSMLIDEFLNTHMT